MESCTSLFILGLVSMLSFVASDKVVSNEGIVITGFPFLSQISTLHFCESLFDLF